MLKTFTASILVFVLLVPTLSHAEVERRRDQFGTDFGYYVYPIAGEIPGLGTAAGVGGSVLNMGDSDTDMTAYYIRGDFSATGVAFLDLQLFPRRLVFDVGYNDYAVAPLNYTRGLDSDSDEYIQPSVEGRYVLGQLTATFDERRYEAFIRGFTGAERLREVLDKDGNAFSDVDQTWGVGSLFSIGGSIDLTDDRLDPRVGTRLETNIRLPEDEASDETEFFTVDLNLTHYIPVRRWDTLVFNIFGSHAFVTRKGETDHDAVKAKEGLGCEDIAPGAEQDACFRTETTRLNQIIAHRKFGTTTSLGGTQRLRSYNNYRFYASRVFFYGIEYRWNLTDEHTPFDIFVAKGIRTGIQVAAFFERGSVSDGYRELWEDGRNSYGLGFRVVLSGVVVRFDVANGDEGFNSQLFITYPWSMFSVDNPG